MSLPWAQRVTKEDEVEGNYLNVLILLCVIFLTYTLSVTVLTWWVAPPKCSAIGIGFNGAIYFLAAKIICSLSTLNYN